MSVEEPSASELYNSYLPGRGDTMIKKWNAADGGFDVTLNSQLQYDQVQAAFEEKAELEPFSRFRVVPLCQRNLRIVTVQVYNPYVGDEAVAAFLRRYGQVDKQTKYLRDSFGIWTGRRQFRVLLGEDPDSADGLKHPPAYFSIGADRGFLFYSGQPVFCRQCRSFGHLAAGCVQVRCRNCGGTGHGAASCTAQRSCHGCGGAGHLLRDCPSRARTYADVAGGSETHKLRPLEEVLQVVREAKQGPGTGAAALAVEVAAASPVKEGLMTEGDDCEGVGAVLSLGDSLPLVGSWADCVASSEEEDMAEAVVAAAGGVRRQRDSSGGDLTESSAEVVPAESRAKGRRRRKKQREGTVHVMDRACDGEGPSTLSGHSGVLDVGSGQEDSGTGSDVREGVPAPPRRCQGMGKVAEGEGGASVRVDGTVEGAGSAERGPRGLMYKACAESPSIVAYRYEGEGRGSEGSVGSEMEGPLGETEKA
ncbi:Zinc finger CCHC domain-containing protein 3 [Collichthys lucidus]|uniref:Zinc finger CCHC domain-containing protein 3 n=1 Tax=Collichthys lucidus TaxID=240159 RepID=A0A4U5TUB5_COLLU|nr:Zinc finger CCHC domain-containing protein 3 [Collichthys lucidus]